MKADKVMLNPDSTVECECVYLAEGIHKITLLISTEEALTECFAHLDNIFAQHPHAEPLRIISDIRQSGVPPLTNLWEYARHLFIKHPQFPVIYDAILHDYGRLFSAFSFVVIQLASLYGARVRFFSADQYDEAVNWLLEQEP
jgi:hypothetical protein